MTKATLKTQVGTKVTVLLSKGTQKDLGMKAAQVTRTLKQCDGFCYVTINGEDIVVKATAKGIVTTDALELHMIYEAFGVGMKGVK